MLIITVLLLVQCGGRKTSPSAHTHFHHFDMFSYHVLEPVELEALQQREWEPLLDWARHR